MQRTQERKRNQIYSYAPRKCQRPSAFARRLSRRLRMRKPTTLPRKIAAPTAGGTLTPTARRPKPTNAKGNHSAHQTRATKPTPSSAR